MHHFNNCLLRGLLLFAVGGRGNSLSSFRIEVTWQIGGTGQLSMDSHLCGYLFYMMYLKGPF